MPNKPVLRFRRHARFAALILTWILAMPSLAAAQTVLEKVAKTGILTAGTSKDAFPLAYADDKGQLVGYSVDMLGLIKTQVEAQLKRPVTLKLVALSPDQRIPSLQSGAVDIICDNSSFTWKRDQVVDFSVSYGITGTRLLVKRGTSFVDPEALVGKRIGALPQTTNEDAIRRAQPKAQVVLFKDRAAGYQALAAGQIDGFAGDGLLLEGWLHRTGNEEKFQVDAYPYSKEGVACMVPENNSKLLDATNFALLGFMQGFVRNRPQTVAIFDRWFGPNGMVPLSQDLRELVKESMQGILDLREELPDSGS